MDTEYIFFWYVWKQYQYIIGLNNAIDCTESDNSVH